MKTTLVAALLICFANLISSSANAARGGDGSAVGNGGGFPETQAVYFHQRLGLILAACLTPENLCQLESEDQASLSKVVKFQDREAREVSLVFSKDLPAGVVLQTARSWGAEILISKSAFYHDDGSPKDSGEIAAVILASRWLHANPASSDVEIVSKSRAMMQTLKYQVHSVTAESSSTTQILHDQVFSFNGVTHRALFIEDDFATFNISDLIESLLPCGKLADTTLSNVRGVLFPGVTQFVGHLNLKCSQTSYLLQVEIPTDRDGRLNSKEVKLHVRADFR